MATRRSIWADKRMRIIGALATLVVVVAALAVVTAGDDPPRRTNLAATGGDTAADVADADPTTTSTTDARPMSSTTLALEPATSTPPSTAPMRVAPATTVAPTTVAPSAETAVTVATDPAGSWTLVRFDGAWGACLQLHVQTFRSERILCGAAAAPSGAVLGDLISFNTPIGRAVVAIVEPRIEGWGASPYQQQHGLVFDDPTPARAAYAYAAGIYRPIGAGGSSMRLFFTIGENTVARSDVAVSDAVVPPGQSLTSTAKPYGTWAGYRRGGTTGLYFGGNEEFGFYDGADGGRCVLYRRLGGEPEAVLFDVCAPKVAGGGLAFASFLPPGPPYATSPGWNAPMLVVLADGLQVVRWTCTTPTGTSCGGTPAEGNGRAFGRGARLAPDPAGSGRQLIGWFPDAMPDLGGARDVTITLYAAGDRQVAQRTVGLP